MDLFSRDIFGVEKEDGLVFQHQSVLWSQDKVLLFGVDAIAFEFPNLIRVFRVVALVMLMINTNQQFIAVRNNK